MRQRDFGAQREALTRQTLRGRRALRNIPGHSRFSSSQLQHLSKLSHSNNTGRQENTVELSQAQTSHACSPPGDTTCVVCPSYYRGPSQEDGAVIRESTELAELPEAAG